MTRSLPRAFDGQFAAPDPPAHCTGVRSRRTQWLSAVLAPVVTLGLGFTPTAGAAPMTPASSLDKQVGDAKALLTAASKAAEDANRSLERAEAEMKPAEAAVARAQSKLHEALDSVRRAQAAEQAARDALKAAQEKVAEQQRQIKIVEDRIAEIVRQISALARKAYIAGGEQRSLAFLLQTDDPADFSLRMEAQRRTSRSNDALFDTATALRAELARQMEILRQLEQKAADQEAEAQRQADAARAASEQAGAARDAAEVAAREVRDLVAARQRAVNELDAKRNEAKRVYQRLLDQQASAQGISRTTGTIRSAKEAVNWAMGWLGRGSSYDGLCLGFVDDSYAAPGGKRVGTAIGQWYRAKAAGKGHPGDRTPPIGAHVFWWSGNPAKHIALYAGNGMVISTGVDGDMVGMRSMDYMDSYGPYIGWAEPYYG